MGDRQARSQRNFGRFTPWSFPDSWINGPAAYFLPVAFDRFSPFPKTRFGPGTPEMGPNRVFFFSDPTIIWEKGNLGAPGSASPLLLLGELTKVNAPFRPPGARKTAETARFGPPAGKTESTAATAPKFRSFYPLESSGLMKKRPATARFSPKISFHPPTSSCWWGWWYESAISM